MNKFREKMKGLWERIRSESGVVLIIEAAYVFPIMFFVIFFMIYFGDMYYVRSSVDMIVGSAAIKGAEYYSNPWVKTVNEDLQGESVPTSNKDVKPYRQLLSDRDIESTIKAEVEKKIKEKSNGVFAGMMPKDISCSTKYKNYVIYSNFSVDVDYKIILPIRFIGSEDSFGLDFSAHEEAVVSDNCEFIRDVDMAVDYVERSHWYNKLKDKLNDVFSKFGK